ncbi:acyltransferase family protein [Rhodopila sp.]|uniref:acyltransferase family protein n=1 Tax=Rhodopila sp. TaxID=2480087 RepID=UPI003D099DD0
MTPADRMQKPRYRYRHFGGFRLLLAMLVMLQHFAADLAPLPLARAFAPYPVGGIAVLVFFALSGFVITEAIDCIYRERAGAFLGNRLLRIVPHFLLAVALSMLAHEIFRATGGARLWRSQPSFPADAFAPINVALNFIGITPFIDRAIDYNFLDITWAVRVEMVFYLVMAGCIAIGARLPGKKGFTIAATAAALLLTPLFAFAVYGRGARMMEFLPYFGFGVGLYFATIGRRAGWLTVALSVPAMLWQSILQQSLEPVAGMPAPSLAGQLIMLGLLLGVLGVLAFSDIARGRDTDRVLGGLTYPLYLYHQDVLVLLLTFTVGYSYAVFVTGILLSLLVAMALTSLVDPMVTRYRDKVRGGALRAGKPARYALVRH